MDFNYSELGKSLVWNRNMKGIRQCDIEEATDHRLKQPAISALEQGRTRMAVDTLIDYCNAIRIRPDVVLDPFLELSAEDEEAELIVDPYVKKLAEIMYECTPSEKEAIVRMAQIISELY